MMKFNTLNYLVGILLFVCSCNENPTFSNQTTWQTFRARNSTLSRVRIPTYRAKIPLGWVRADPNLQDCLEDTKKPIVEFFIPFHEESIRVTVHTFPFKDKTERIAPQAQVSRWQTQLQHLDPFSVLIEAVSHDGFSGLFFEGKGFFENRDTMFLGWSLQLSSHYISKLRNEPEKLADYTIKVYGDPEAIERHKKEIQCFATSFELIEELPQP